MTDNVFAPPRANVDVREGPEALWALSFKEIRKLYYASLNIRALGVLYGIGAVGLIGLSVAMLLAPSENRGAAMTGTLVFVAFSLPSILAMVTSFTRPRWGRWLGILMCVLNLINFPVGTLISIWGLVAYAQGGRLFGPDRFAHKDVALVFKQRKHDKA